MRKLKLEELNRVSVSEFKNQPKIPVVVVLDDIRSAMNVGSVFRTSDAFAIEKLCLCGITAKPPHREITKTAIGATESVEWEYFSDISDCLDQMILEERIIIGIEQTDVSAELDAFPFNTENKYAVILGNEVNGITDKILPMINEFIEIPQFGTKHSLNVSVCAGITLWQIHKNFRNPAG